jgi:hypothetical protein
MFGRAANLVDLSRQWIISGSFADRTPHSFQEISSDAVCRHLQVTCSPKRDSSASLRVYSEGVKPGLERKRAMKTSRMSFLLAIVILCGPAWRARAQGQTGPKDKLTLDEVKTLIKNATTSEDHLKLAGFFRQEEAQQMESAKTHDELSEVYQFSKAPTPAVADMQKHCKDFALGITKRWPSFCARALERRRHCANDHEL